MEEWLQRTLSSDHLGLAALPAVFLLGVFAAASSCCTLPVLGAVTGYSGTLGGGQGRRELLFLGLFFLIGTVLSLTALGAVSSFVGHLAGAALGRYWRFAAGLLAVLFGLATLDFLPLRLPKIDLGGRVFGRGVAGAVLCGLVVGGATSACAVGCNPLLSLAIGAAVLKGTVVLGAAMLAVFALGFSLPLVAALIGIGLGLGRFASATKRAMPFIRAGASAVLVGVGFYLLATV